MSEHSKILPDQALACEKCGRFGAVEIGDHVLCLDCYEDSGSCCPEFGCDDLWTFEDEPARQNPVRPKAAG